MSGWKDWQQLEVVTEADFQSYIQDQVVQYYANSAARSSAVPLPTVGMVSYLDDTNSLEVRTTEGWTPLKVQDYTSQNFVINGAFDINQRGFTSTTTDGSFLFDRWQYAASAGTSTLTASAFTLGAAPVAGYEGTNYLNFDVTTGNDYCRIQHKLESVRTLAGQTATLSFWAKGTNPATTGNLAVEFRQNFGTGGSPSSEVVLTQQTFVLTSNWTRYSFVFAIPSIAGKTIGTANNDFLALFIGQGTSTSTDPWELDIWGVQLEAGSVATPFRRHAPSLQGELAACQRYYQRIGGTGNQTRLLNGNCVLASPGRAVVNASLKTTMRATPSIVLGAGVTFISLGSNISATVQTNRSNADFISLYLAYTSGTFDAFVHSDDDGATDYFEAIAEL